MNIMRRTPRWKLAWARRLGWRSLAARVLTVALLATLAALAAPQAPPLQAQTVTTLVSNTNLTPSSSGSTNFQAQRFETGANAGGYTVSEVDVQLFVAAGRDTSVKIRASTSSGEPGDLVATLTNPDTLTDASPNTFTAPAGTTLAANTTYFISVNEGISIRASLGRVSGDGETGETGWSIDDERLQRTNETDDLGLQHLFSDDSNQGHRHPPLRQQHASDKFDGRCSSSHFQAQSFETGATTDGYTVSEVDIFGSVTVSGRSTSVSIRENNADNEPGALVATLTNPDVDGQQSQHVHGAVRYDAGCEHALLAKRERGNLIRQGIS